MSGKTAVLAVRILGDSDSAVRALNEAERAVQSAEATTKKSGKSMAGVWTAVAAGLVAVTKASAMTESATVALNTIFGEQGDEMVAWAEGMAEYGLSTAQAGAAAAVLGAQLLNAGFSAEQMTVITQGLVETSAQLAQVMGGSAVEAAQAMGAALRGEFDSLERYGITITADAVATEQLRLASEGYTFATEAQAKAVATLSLIQQGATTILAGAEEGVVTMSMATDHLKASTMNLASAIGDVLTPILGPLIEKTAGVVDQLTQQIQSSELLAEASAALSSILAAAAEILDPVLASALSLVSTTLNALWDILDGLVVPVLEALARALDTVADALAYVIGWVESAIAAFERFISTIREAIDSLTFWNDSYQASASLSAPAPALAALGRGRGGAPDQQRSPAPVTINITAGVGADPHAIAREIRRVLRTDAARMGRPGPAL